MSEPSAGSSSSRRSVWRRRLSRAWDSAYLWGALGWLLLFLRYTSEVVLPQYGR